MGRRCKTCQHSKRGEIEQDLLNSVTYRNIGTKYGISYVSVRRHFENGHIAQGLVKATELRKVAYSENLLDKLLYLQHEALKVLDQAKNPIAGPPLLTVALSAIGRAASMLETQAKLAGQLKDLDVNIAVNTHWLAIKQEVFAILKTHPAAQKAIEESVANGKLSDLEKSMVGAEAGEFADVTPAVLEIINSEFKEDPEEPGPDLRPPSVHEKPKPKPRREPEPEVPPRRRMRYRCTRAHNFHGKHWAVGQVWDSINPDGVEPPAGSDDWVIYNPADEESAKLMPTRR